MPTAVLSPTSCTTRYSCCGPTRGACCPFYAWAVALEVAGIGIAVTATAAVGLPVNLGHTVVLYGTAVLFGIVGFLPGGLGFVELTTVGLLVSYGTPAPRAAAAIVLYRGLELWLPALVGGLAAARSPR